MKSIAQKIEKIYESKLAIKNSLLKKGIQTDKNKTSIKFNSSTLEKVSNLQYTQLS